MDELVFSALMCSKVCHDLISPVGALANGLEVLEEDDDEEMKAHAMALINSSAQTASAKLQFARMAYGSAGGLGAQIDIQEAGKVAKNLYEDDRRKVNWDLPAQTADKDLVKLMLNLLHIACEAIPRGGEVEIRMIEVEGAKVLEVKAAGPRARYSDEVREAVEGRLEESELTARSIQPSLTGLLARKVGSGVVPTISEDVVLLSVNLA